MRDMVFLSHANPEDNAITEWLALQLAREGYPVWCDLTKLLGGEDFWEDIELAIRERTTKFLYVLSRASNHKQGSLKEVAVANKIQKKEKLKDFIIPLWVDDLPSDDFNIEIGRLNAVRFQSGWAKGLAGLLKKLEKDGVAKKPGFGPAAVTSWWREHASANGGLRTEPETLVSNWYPLEPATLYYHELTRSGLGPLEITEELPYPGFRHNQYLISFAPAGAFGGRLGSQISIRSSLTRSVAVADPGPIPIRMSYSEERSALSNLLRQSWLAMVKQRNLPEYVLANNAVAFFFTKGQVPDDKVRFIKADGSRSYRGVVGYKTVGRPGAQAPRYWHFALRGKPMSSPLLGYTMKPHVVFSDDGRQLWSNKQRLHRARRSQCKNWWNDDWRDRIAASVSWLANGDTAIALPVGPDETIRVSTSPVQLESPVSYIEPAQAVAGETIPADEEEELEEDESGEDWDDDAEPE